jgi:lipid II:glycine glycyltransferase (peptidoglycan interpeptide bridge formation enzyme)
MGLDRAEIPFWVESHGFELGLAFGPYSMQPGPGMATCNADQIIDLLRDEELLFGSLEESCRRAVRRAASFGLTVESLSGDGSVERYYRLAQLSATRTGEALAPFQYYADVWEAFSHIGESRILAVERNGELIAAILLLVYKHAVSFLGGVSDPDALSMRVNDFAHWSAMVWAKHEGLRWYRLGPWFPTVDPDWTIAKVSRFKKKFGGNSRTIIQGSLFRRPERYRAEAHGLVDLNCSRSHR